MRCLSDDEMRNGLDAGAAAELWRQRAAVHDRPHVAKLIDICLELKMATERKAAFLLADGHPAYVKVEGVDGIVRQMPDGTRHAIKVVDGLPVVVRALPPASGA